MPEQDAPLHRFGLLLVPGFSSLAVNLVTEPLFIANWLAGRSLFTWQTLSVDGFAVRSSNGSQTSVDAPLTGDPQADFDTVFVVASFDVRASAEKTRMIEWLRSTARTRVRVGAIEIGSEILMEAGLLHGSSIPVHWYNAKGSEERFHDIKVTETLFETAGRHPLSAGGLATLDMMLDHIAQDAGDSLAEEVGRHLLVDMAAPGHAASALSRACVAQGDGWPSPRPRGARLCDHGGTTRPADVLHRHCQGSWRVDAAPSAPVQGAARPGGRGDLSRTTPGQSASTGSADRHVADRSVGGLRLLLARSLLAHLPQPLWHSPQPRPAPVAGHNGLSQHKLTHSRGSTSSHPSAELDDYRHLRPNSSSRHRNAFRRRRDRRIV